MKWLEFKRWQSIPFLLTAGGALYILLGGLLFLELGGSPTQYLGFLFGASVFFLVAICVRKLRGDIPSYGLLLCVQISLVQQYFFAPSPGSAYHFVCAALFLVAAVDASLVMTPRARSLNRWGATLSTVAAMLAYEMYRHWMIAAAVLVLITWKFLLHRKFEEVLEERLKARQLEAFRATVVTLNHEFNNVAAICAGLLVKIQSDNSQDRAVDALDIEMLDRNLKRLVSLIKRFRHLDSYQEVVYVGDVKMVDLPAGPEN